jgi:ribonuclease D
LTPELLRRLCWSPPVPTTLEGIRSALAEMGARPWQIDATAQVIDQAFVDASQTIETAPEGDS